MKRPTAQKILNVLAGPGRELVLAMGVRADSCIFMGRVAYLVLKAFNHPVKIVPVRFWAYSPRLVELLTQHKRWPEDRQELERWRDEGAWLVEINTNNDTAKGLPGHLVVVSGGFMADLSLDQASRPAKGLVIDNWVRPNPLDLGMKEFAMRTKNGGQIEYELIDLPPSMWKNAPDWKNLDDQEPIVVAIKKYIQAETHR